MAKSVKLTMLTGLDTGITWEISEDISRSLISLYSEQCIPGRKLYLKRCCGSHWLWNHFFLIGATSEEQGDFNCGTSSKADFILNYFLSNSPFPPSPACRLEPCWGARQRLSLQGAQMQPLCNYCNCKSSLVPKFVIALWFSLQAKAQVQPATQLQLQIILGA